jgi:hypothetical protein
MKIFLSLVIIALVIILIRKISNKLAKNKGYKGYMNCKSDCFVCESDKSVGVTPKKVIVTENKVIGLAPVALPALPTTKKVVKKVAKKTVKKVK